MRAAIQVGMRGGKLVRFAKVSRIRETDKEEDRQEVKWGVRDRYVREEEGR